MRCTCLILLAFTLGCRTSTSNRLVPGDASTFDPRVGTSRTSVAEPTETVRRSAVRQVSFEAGANALLADPSSGPVRLTLQDAIRTARSANPDLVALRHNEPVSLAALEVARTYPFNPQVGLDVRPFTREANGDNAAVLVSTSVTQEFELAGQSRYREQAGAADHERTRWNISQAEIVVTAQTEQRFFTALHLRQRSELANSLAELNQKMFEALERRFEAGQATATDVALARLQAASTRQQAELARSSFEASLIELRGYLGLPATATIEPLGDLAAWRWLSMAGPGADSPEAQPHQERVPPDRNEPNSNALSQWTANRPDVRAAQADVEAARARLDLACAARVPNIKAGPVYEHDEAGTTFLGLEASVALPVVNTGEPLVRQRHAELHQRLATFDQLELKARLEIQAALQRYERARQVTERYNADFWDKLAEDVRRIEDQFDAGQTDLLRVYSARTGMIQSRMTYLDSLQELARAATAITAATGLGPEAFLSVTQQNEP